MLSTAWLCICVKPLHVKRVPRKARQAASIVHIDMWINFTILRYFQSGCHFMTCNESYLLFQVHRGKKTVYEGTLSSLRRVKESVKEIDQGNECGVGCKEFIGWEAGDKIEAFELVSKRRTLEDIVAAPQMAAVQL